MDREPLFQLLMNRLFGPGPCETGTEALNIVDFALHGDSGLSKAAEPVPRSSGLFWQELVQLNLLPYNSCKGSQGQACSALLYKLVEFCWEEEQDEPIPRSCPPAVLFEPSQNIWHGTASHETPTGRAAL